MIKIAGVDEAGRGPLAGPVVAAAVILRPGYHNAEITDSKKLTKDIREQLSEEIKANAIKYSIIAVGPRRIEAINIREATKLAMRLAIEKIEPDYAMIDGNMRIPVSCGQETIIKGDLLVASISAASILAKVYRDALMAKLAQRYSGYGFEQHQGYGTPKHLSAVVHLGPCRAHRRTFAGVKEHVFGSTPDQWEDIPCSVAL